MRNILLKRNFFRFFPVAKVKEKCAALYNKLKLLALRLSVAMTMAYIMSVTAFAATTTNPSGARDIWGWLDYALNDMYQKFAAVSTIAACVAAAICLIMMNFSTDDRAVSTSRAWLKRIAISWIILNVLGFIIAYLVDVTGGGRYVPSTTP